MIEPLVENNRDRSTRRDLIELAVGYGLILLVLWSPRPYQKTFFWSALAWIIAVTAASARRGYLAGYDLRSALRAWWTVPVAIGCAAGAMAAAAKLGTLHPFFGPTWRSPRIWGYAIWAFEQQFILQNFVLLRLYSLTGSKRWAILGGGMLFAIAHLPNPVLTCATLAWGLAACALFVQYRNIYAISVVHVILGFAIAVTVPSGVHHNMRVGLGYYSYPGHNIRSRLIKLQAPVSDSRVWMEEQRVGE